MNDNIKMVVADIDGTLNVSGDAHLLPVVKKALEDLHEAGVLIGIASGRPIYQIKRNMMGWHLKYEPDFIIGFNGAELYDKETDKQYQQNFLTAEQVKGAFDHMAPFRDRTNAFIYFHEGMLFEKDDVILHKAATKYSGIESVTLAKDPSELWAEGNAKIHFRCLDVNDMPEVEKYVKETPHPYLTGSKTQKDLMELFHKDVSKGNMLTEYCGRIGIDLANVAAFGDTTNDNSMLEVAGVAVCLLNGSDDTKALADYITEYECKDGGFGHFVNKYILEK
ncbi:MAG: HAD-IIB family hydrolase [Erysipelotrichaceae bacterium]|nr:HAD-IIB family hydrolase [Erysipelotrichaceae bacterium]